MAIQKKIVLNILKKKGKPMGPGDIAKEAGLDSKEVSRVIKELKKEGLVYSPKRCFYAPRGG
ncbi:transcriptional regulator [bacterium]|nr:MAG: transcriptional regulator [bacterium]